MTKAGGENLFWDTNVFLDIILRREPFFFAAAELWNAVEEGRFGGQVSIPTLITIDYIVRKTVGKAKTRQAIQAIMDVFRVVESAPEAVAFALASRWTDFEDAVQYCTAMLAGADYFIARNARDFQISAEWKPKVFAPEAFLLLIA